MALRINTNVAALTAQRFLGKQDEQVQHALAALSSGSRIVRPADDAAGLAISENLRGQIAGLRQSGRNAENAISLIQVAEGGLNEQNNILIRLRELGVQAASDTVSDVERGFLNQEFNQLVQEFDRIANTTTFGNKKLLDGSGGAFTFHVGPNAGKENEINYNLDADATGSTMGISGLAITDRDDARDNLRDIDKALEKISAIRANFGAIQSRLTTAASNNAIQVENVSAAKSRLSDTDVAEEAAKLAQGQVLQEAGIAVLAQSSNLPARATKLINNVL